MAHNRRPIRDNDRLAGNIGPPLPALPSLYAEGPETAMAAEIFAGIRAFKQMSNMAPALKLEDRLSTNFRDLPI
jgi:hypothetical protein